MSPGDLQALGAPNVAFRQQSLQAPEHAWNGPEWRIRSTRCIAALREGPR